MNFWKTCKFFSSQNEKKLNASAIVGILILFLSIIGCSEDNEGGNKVIVNASAVVATAASDYSSGAHSVITYNKPRTASNNLVPTVSDISIVAHGNYFYRIGRHELDTITKFSIDAPATPICQFTTMDSNDNMEGIVSSNPQTILFVNNKKGYLIRRGSKRAWIINPSATTQAEFKIGELDLSAYVANNDTDGDPEMAGGIIVGNKLFILLQRTNGYKLLGSSYIAVFDTTTDNEIETNQGSDGLTGIELMIQIPSDIFSYGNKLFIASAGRYGREEAVSGLQIVDAETYISDETLITNDIITQVVIVNETKGYYIKYGYKDCAIIPFNPTTKEIGNALSGIGNDLRCLAVDHNETVWIGSTSWDEDNASSRSGIFIINPADNSIDEGPIPTDLVPIAIDFCDQ